jgi:ubiquitin carboxyl-terminal hydrolase 5/13
MKQVKVVNHNSNEDKKITKLAIGKPGGADFSNETWELWTTLYCQACNVQIDYSQNKQLSDLVTSIINTASANEQSSISAWEEEIFPCEHTLMLKQADNIKIPPKYNATCNDCLLSSNLWLCLTCGNLGCGRKNWDGTGGNNHGIEHFEKCKHPLVVKTGTITPTGDACIFH